ncbi:hypothetical protein BV20DRAFT_570110 [Pilatotrama ljubarskyi]|nr:hypothetical protein BV20DRAFT_570110 [Pilatotrama ljubarskyi]
MMCSGELQRRWRSGRRRRVIMELVMQRGLVDNGIWTESVELKLPAFAGPGCPSHARLTPPRSPRPLCALGYLCVLSKDVLCSSAPTMSSTPTADDQGQSSSSSNQPQSPGGLQQQQQQQGQGQSPQQGGLSEQKPSASASILKERRFKLSRCVLEAIARAGRMVH